MWYNLVIVTLLGVVKNCFPQPFPDTFCATVTNGKPSAVSYVVPAQKFNLSPVLLVEALDFGPLPCPSGVLEVTACDEVVPTVYAVEETVVVVLRHGDLGYAGVATGQYYCPGHKP